MHVIQLAGWSMSPTAALGKASMVPVACDAAFGDVHALPADHSGGGLQKGIPSRSSSMVVAHGSIF